MRPPPLYPSLLPLLLPRVFAAGTITLTLATTSAETARTLSLPFSTLFTPTSPARGVSIQVSVGAGIPIAQDAIKCQCFSDSAGKQPLGGVFDNVFPGTKLTGGEQPVEIGSIFCADGEGLGRMMGAAGTTAGVVTAMPSSTMVMTKAMTTAATSAVATSTAGLNGVVQAPSSSSSSAASSSAEDTATAFIKFSLSSDPSDDSSTQMSVPIDSSIKRTGGKRVASLTIITVTAQKAGSRVVCQAFADGQAAKPIAAGFGVEEERDLGNDVEEVEAVGCAMVGGGGFGGLIGLVGS
ncbi:MAG: hypothetical protein Q9220_000135 [cf. Caloplaca sp. 1 TL-2023]